MVAGPSGIHGDNALFIVAKDFKVGHDHVQVHLQQMLASNALDKTSTLNCVIVDFVVTIILSILKLNIHAISI
jgi:hypothetical protein